MHAGNIYICNVRVHAYQHLPNMHLVLIHDHICVPRLIGTCVYDIRSCSVRQSTTSKYTYICNVCKYIEFLDTAFISTYNI